MLLAVRLKWRRSVVVGRSQSVGKVNEVVLFGSFVMCMSCMVPVADDTCRGESVLS